MANKKTQTTWIDTYKELLQKSFLEIQKKETPKSSTNNEIFSKRTPNDADIKSLLKKHTEDIAKHGKEMKIWKAILIFTMTLLAANLVTWYYEAHYRIHKLELEYVKNISELQNQIDILKNQNENLQEDIISIKEDYKIDSLEIEKEVERQLNSKIIDFNFNIIKGN